MNVNYYLLLRYKAYECYTYKYAPLVISLGDKIYIVIKNTYKRLTKGIISYIIKRPELYYAYLPENFLDSTTIIKGRLVGTIYNVDIDIEKIHDIIIDMLYDSIDKALFADVYNGVRKISFCE